jgi:hypothetical protein
VQELEAMYRELSGDYMAPLASPEALRLWREREDDFVKLVDRVTRQLTTQHRLLPMDFDERGSTAAPGSEGRGYRRRYVSPVAGDTAPCYSVGVRDSFAEYLTPVWLRFHKDTGDFERIRQRIKDSDLQRVDSGGHIWIPLTVPTDVSGEEIVADLFEQAKAVERVAFPEELTAPQGKHSSQ